MLDENPGAPGVLLWRALRSVTLWASTAPAARRELFSPGAVARWLGDCDVAEVPAELRRPLAALAAIAAPRRSVPAERVARACVRVARWAEARGAAGTALCFAQAAALALPGSPGAALETALLAERRGHDARAESWLRRAAALARARGDRVARARAYQALARLLARRGEWARAEHLLGRAARLAGRCGLRTPAAGPTPG